MALAIRPADSIKFRRPFKHCRFRTVTLTNESSEPILFKAKTTAPRAYCVKPNYGVVEPQTTMNVRITKQVMTNEPPLEEKCGDRFLFQSITLTSRRKSRDDLSELWETLSSSGRIFQRKLNVEYYHPPVLTNEEPDELVSVNPSPFIHFSGPFVQDSIASMFLVNVTHRPVLYKVMTNNPKDFCVRPNHGRLDPEEKSSLLVIRQGRTKGSLAYPDSRADKFMVLSTLLPEDKIGVEWNETEFLDVWKSARESVHGQKLLVTHASVSAEDDKPPFEAIFNEKLPLDDEPIVRVPAKEIGASDRPRPKKGVLKATNVGELSRNDRQVQGRSWVGKTITWLVR